MASAEAAASAASSAAATAAAAALFKVASNLWMAEASAVGPLLLPEEEHFTTLQSDTGNKSRAATQRLGVSFLGESGNIKLISTAGLTHNTQRTNSSIVLP